MHPILSPQDLGRLRQAMLLGLARNPLAVPERMKPLVAAAPPERDSMLAVLALAGQQQRFQGVTLDQGAGAVPEAARRMHEDERPIMPEPARRTLLRLANAVEKGAADAVLSAAVRRVAHAGFRLHPFDLPRLIGHIKADARCLGLAERAYLALADSSSVIDTPSLLHAEITPENWTGFPKSHRVAFLRDERRKNPAKARALLEGVFKSEPAPVRGDLLAALDVGLGIDDLAFLEAVAADRAESVRTIASELAAGVPGTEAYTARLAEVARCFVRSRPGVTGILSRIGLASTPAVVFTPPPTSDRAERVTLLAKLFDRFSAAEIAAAGGLKVAEVIGSLPPDEEAVYTALSQRAARDDDHATMVQLVEARLATTEGRAYSPAHLLAWLANNRTGPVSLDFGNTLMGSAAWQGALQRFKDATTPAAMKDDGTLIWTAAVLPAGLVASFIERITSLSPATTRIPRDFADLVLALEVAPTQQR